MTGIAVAAISARVLAEAAAREGFEVVALDLFGDIDTRRAAAWQSLGETGTLRIDGERLLHALATLAREGKVQGWIAGAGFDGRPELLAAGARQLPLIGNPSEVVRRVRDPREFFAVLDRRGIAHPPVSFEPPTEAAGWLRKDAAGCGGWHIRPACASGEPPLAPTQYFQRERSGLPVSATFLANGREFVLLGCNEQIVGPVVGHAHVYGGVIGPVLLAPAARSQMHAALAALIAEFGLRGLGSLDVLLDGERVEALELNPRPPASLALYTGPGSGWMAAHCRACVQGQLPGGIDTTAAPQGHAIVFARRTLQLGERACVWLSAQPDTHDLPTAGTRCTPGDPVCSVSAAGGSAGDLRSRLALRRTALLEHLETIE